MSPSVLIRWCGPAAILAGALVVVSLVGLRSLRVGRDLSHVCRLPLHLAGKTRCHGRLSSHERTKRDPSQRFDRGSIMEKLSTQ
jgi:hypothetical protein